MRDIKLSNERLATLLSSITDLFYNGEVKDLVFNYEAVKDPRIEDLHPCSMEYFDKARTFSIEEYGFPQACKGVSESSLHPQDYDKLATVRKKVSRISNFLGTPVNALVMSYPDNGYIGWHHNGNAPGYNVLLTHSQDGKGKFSYYDYATDSVVHLQDKPGWNVRVGYYPNQYTEPERVFWHAADTEKQRITLAWVINHKDMWKNMIDEITGGDYDKAILDQ